MKSILYVVIAMFILQGCGSGPKIVVPSYSAPREAAKLTKIETKDEFIAKGAYMALWLDPNVINAKKYNKAISGMMVATIKEQLTQTNFIVLDPIQDENSVILTTKVLSYVYKKEKRKASLYMEVSFTLSRGADEFLVKKYHARKLRMANDPSLLPSKNDLTQDAIKQIVRYFISDISPLKTNQLREFKPFPDKLKPTLSYVRAKNYTDAINFMLAYKGEKDKNFYYNLAIIYEAKASKNEDLKFLRFAKLNYNKAVELGGADDELIMKTKARFDRFYNLINKTKKQQKINNSLIKDRNSLLGGSDNEYE